MKKFADVLFTVVGLGYLVGVDVERAFREVCERNLKKVEGGVEFDEFGKVKKKKEGGNG